ncbi:MAG: hypothetical protein LUF84_07230 [Clostridiales bacterium]|nr:hypothetical protein [Clostridiales bacterium]
MMRKKLVTMLLMAAVMVFAISGCGSSSDSETSGTDGETDSTQTATSTNDAVAEFETCAKAGEYRDAIDLYTSEIEGSTSAESEVVSFLEDWMVEIAENICDADGVISSDYKDEMYTLLKINDSLALIDTDDLLLLQSGIEDYNEGDYESAVVSLNDIADDDIDTDAVETFKTAVSEKYVESVVQKAWAYIDAGEYTSAVDLLNAMQYTDDTVEEIMTEAMTARFEEAMEAETDFATIKGLYEAALDNRYIEVSADMTEVYAAAETSYREGVIASVDDYVDSFAFGSALTLLDEALTVLENDDQLLACKTETEEAQEYYLLHTTVVDLTELTPYDESYISTAGADDKDTDAFGNVYETNIHGDWSDGGYATYRLDGIYVEFTGTVYSRIDKSRTVSIYGDGVLLYEATLTKTDDPVPFSVDITGVRDLKIVFDGQKIYIGNPTLTPDGNGSME